MKTCSKCGEVKPLDAFESGRNTCKACRAEYRAAYQATEAGKAAKRRYEDNPEKAAIRLAYRGTAANAAAKAKYVASEKGAFDAARRRVRKCGLDPSAVPEIVQTCAALLEVKRILKKRQQPKRKTTC